MSVILSLAKAPAPQPTGPSIDGLLKVTEQLTLLIEKEVEALNSDHLRDITGFQDEKNRLYTIYARELALVRANPDQVAEWPQETLEQLKEMTRRFQSALKTHVTVVDRVKGVTETVLRSIGKHVAERTRPVIGYGKDAGKRLANAKAPISLAFDQAV